MTTCVECKFFDLKALQEMTRVDFGRCPHQNVDIGYSKKSRAAMFLIMRSNE